MKGERAEKIIIVGGGTAGSVMARTLAENASVMVIEKSKNKTVPLFFTVPLMIGLLFNKDNKWVKKHTIKFGSNRLIPFFKSNMLGGASVINGCVHAAGIHSRWLNLLSRFELTKNDLEASYTSLYSKKNRKGTIRLSEAKCGELDKAYYNALEEKGIERGGVEWADRPAYGSIINTVGRIFRASVISLKPFRDCIVKIDVKIERLVVNDALKVIGVTDGSNVFLSDRVILCAGVVGTNLLLQNKALRLSDKSYMDLGLDAGQGVKDHTNLRINVESSVSCNSLNEIDGSFLEKVRLFGSHVLGIKTLMMGTGATSTAHLDLNGNGEVDTRINLLHFSETGRMGSDGKMFSSSQPGFSISITTINPKSHGVIVSNGDKVSVEPNYLSCQSDVEHLKKALSFVISLLESESFRGYVNNISQIEEIKNTPEQYIAKNIFSGFHLIGGCSDLIDTDFRIPRLGELYICDASIINDYPSSNIHSTVVILSDLFARKLQNKISSVQKTG